MRTFFGRRGGTRQADFGSGMILLRRVDGQLDGSSTPEFAFHLRAQAALSANC